MKCIGIGSAARRCALACWLSAGAFGSGCDGDDAPAAAPAVHSDGGAPRAPAVIRFARPPWHAASDAGPAHDAGPPIDPVLARGEYLVRHVGGCMDCHTPRLTSGLFDESRLLSGIEDLADVEPDDPTRGALHSRNLTPDDKTGLGRWTDAQIRKAFQQGIDDESTVLHWMMPYWIFGNMDDADADAIVKFLRTIPKVVHNVPDNQPNAVDSQKPYQPYTLELARIPDSSLAESHADFASARRGRYLATALAPCLLCHTPPDPDSAARPIDLARAFTGRRKFAPAPLGLKIEGLGEIPLIESQNLTPHANGIGGWSVQDVANALRQGVGRTLPVCDPMPSTNPGDTFRGMSADDALALGRFFTTLPAQDTGVIPECCIACHQPPTDAGAGDRDADLP